MSISRTTKRERIRRIKRSNNTNFSPNRRKTIGSTDAYGAGLDAPQAEIGGRRKGMPCIGALRGDKVAPVWRDCARRRERLRIPCGIVLSHGCEASNALVTREMRFVLQFDQFLP